MIRFHTEISQTSSDNCILDEDELPHHQKFLQTVIDSLKDTRIAMAFFDNIKTKLIDALDDITTLEHALIVEEDNGSVYQRQQIDGDSICHLSNTPVDIEYIKLFNEAYLAGNSARTQITEFIIECLT